MGNVFHAPPGIYQLIEIRNGRKSCWGVVIQLSQMRFNKKVMPNQIMISEAKHGHELSGIMNWHVSRDAKRLVIRFKRGAGDFGSGNAVDVRIERAAFVASALSLNDYYGWSVSTDLL